MKQLKDMIPYGKHFVDEDDIEAVVEVLRDGWLTQGPKVEEFEKAVANYTGANFAVAVSSGTAGLHLACIVADVKCGTKVVTSANTFVASPNAVLYQGGSPSFCDIDKNSLNMCVMDLERSLKVSNGVDIIMPVHFGGLPCDMQAIKQLSERYKALVIEDASHAFGATYHDGGSVGNCQYSDMTIFSLHPVKGVTSGEGGVITTNSEKLYRRLLRLRSHGICKGNFDLPGISSGHTDILKYPDEALYKGQLNPWYYEMQELGYNYRITDFQCALALSQMKKFKTFLKRRRAIASAYDDLFSGCKNISIKQLNRRDSSSLHLYVIEINFERIGKHRAEVMRLLKARNVGTQVHYIPVPLHPYYAELGFDIKNYPITREYYNNALSIPIYYGLTDNQTEMVAEEILNLADV